MPVYDISGSVSAPLSAIDVLVDAGTPPATVLVTATSEGIYNALTAFFAGQPSIPLDGSHNIIETTSDWKHLMNWATRPYSSADDFSGDPQFLEYILQVLQIGAQGSNVSPVIPPYWKNSLSVLKLTQPEALSYLIYLCRGIYKGSGLPEPVQVPWP